MYDSKKFHLNSHYIANCTSEPEYVKGEFWGHFFAAGFLVSLALIQYVAILSRYFKAKFCPEYEFNGIVTRIAFPCNPRLSYTSYILPALILYVVLAFSTHIKEEGGFLETLLFFIHGNPHTYNWLAFIFYIVVELLENYESLHMPKYSSQVAFAFTIMTMAGVAYTHLIVRCAYDTLLHSFFFYSAVVSSSSLIAQMSAPRSFFLAALVCFSTAMTGIWLVTLATLAYVYPQVNRVDWMSQTTAQKMQAIPTIFFFDATFLFFGMCALFFIFRAVRGKRARANNWSFELVPRPDKADFRASANNCFYEPLDRFDSETKILEQP
ncbi:unnamed protein product [Notodromas monacha]|uniref:Uncharacterized protein n=1 Tax=Notodromas monacha TaxID=399045 RepID=A0A7R9GHQ9_9CRUS|nr:unnamed protein product [Notodromas monacha]CAG0921766.1 unnamed protein product [Notodromas monacha]